MKIYKAIVNWTSSGTKTFFFTEEEIEDSDTPEEAAEELFSLKNYLVEDGDFTFDVEVEEVTNA